MSWLIVIFFKQKTSYEMRISDWSSDVCSSDLDIWPVLQCRHAAVRGDDIDRARPQRQRLRSHSSMGFDRFSGGCRQLRCIARSARRCQLSLAEPATAGDRKSDV